MADLAELEIRIKSLEVESATRRLSNLQREGVGAERVAGRLSNAFSKYAAILSSVTGGLTVLGSLTRGITLAAKLEQLQASFTLVLGSGEKALKLLQEIDSFADGTPFSFEGLAQTARQMLAVGFNAEKVLPILRTVADATEAVGGGEDTLRQLARAFELIQLKAKLSSQEILLLTRAGVPAGKILSEALGKTLPQTFQLIEKGAIKSDAAIKILLEGLDKRFKGTTATLAETTTGLFQQIRNKAESTLRALGTALIDGLNLRGKLKGVMEFFERFGPLLIDLVRHLLGLPILFERNRETVARLAEEIKKVTQVAGWIALTAVINNLSSSIVNVARSARVLTLALLENPWTIIPTLISAAVAALVTYRNETVTVLGTTAQIGDFLVATWEHIRDKIIFVWQFISDSAVAAWEGIKDTIEAVLVFIRATVNRNVLRISEGWTDGLERMMEGTKSIFNFMLSAVIGFTRAVGVIFDRVGDVFGGLLEALTGFQVDWSKIFEFLVDVLVLFVTKSLSLLGYVAKGIGLLVQELQQDLAKLSKEIPPPKTDNFERGFERLRKALDTKGLAQDVAGAFLSAFNEDHIGKLSLKISGGLSKALSIALGAAGPAGQVAKFFLGLAEKNAPSFKKFFDPISEIADIQARAAARAYDRLMKEIIAKAVATGAQATKLLFGVPLKAPDSFGFRPPKLPKLGGGIAGTDPEDLGLNISSNEAVEAQKQIKDLVESLQDEIGVVNESNGARQKAIELLKFERLARKALSDDDLARGDVAVLHILEDKIRGFKRLMAQLDSLGKSKGLRDHIESLENELTVIGKLQPEQELNSMLRALEINDVSKLTDAQKLLVEQLYRLLKAREQLNRETSANKALTEGLAAMKLEIDLIGKSNAERTTALFLRQLEIEKIDKMSDATKKLIADYAKLAKELDRATEVQKNAESLAGAFTDAFGKIIKGAESVGDAFKGLLQNVLDIIIQIAVLDPLKKSLTSFLSPVAGALTPNAKGNVFSGGGRVVPMALGGLISNNRLIKFAQGGLPEFINSPTMFPLAGGNMGLAGERGPEVAIAPLGRTPSGELGVKMIGGPGGGGNQRNVYQQNTFIVPDPGLTKRSRRQIAGDLRNASNA